MQLREVFYLAALYCPIPSFSSRIFISAEWGPGHELAHALLASQRERTLPEFGLNADSVAGRAYALTAEAASMRLSFQIHRRCGRADLVDDEIRYTDEESVTLIGAARTWRLVRQRRCLRLPSTIMGLEAFCRRRGLRPQPVAVLADRLDLLP